jgi:hypothetical protein
MKLVQLIGLFAEGMWMYGEDNSLALRIKVKK